MYHCSIGTVLGFVVSYRTTSSFDRYNEGRVLWSQIVLASRSFSRAVWFYVPDELPAATTDSTQPRGSKVRALLEKKTALNLVEAYAVAVKHYLRGEEGIYYVDLYHLVKYLPQYALPAGMPSQADLGDSAEDMPSLQSRPRRSSDVRSARSVHSQTAPPSMPSLPKVEEGELPLPAASSPRRNKKATWKKEQGEKDEKVSTHSAMEDGMLLPARMPPKYHLLDLWPLSLLVRWLTKKGKDVKVGVTRHYPASNVHIMSCHIGCYCCADAHEASCRDRHLQPPPRDLILLGKSVTSSLALSMEHWLISDARAPT